jgi:hypothetical protein
VNSDAFAQKVEAAYQHLQTLQQQTATESELETDLLTQENTGFADPTASMPM